MKKSLSGNVPRGLLFLFFSSCTLAIDSSSTLFSQIIPGGSVKDLVNNVTSDTPLSSIIPAEETENKVCYDRLGCFNLGAPWKTTLRPMPLPWTPKDISPTVTLFTRESSLGHNVELENSDISLKNSDFKPNRAVTVIITHGFASNGQADWLHKMKDAYLRNVDANAFILDWGNGAQITNYLQVASNTRIVGAQLARFLKHLMKNDLNPKNIHLIGHSLGSHIMSYCAKNLSQISKINRITALDPAQPGFEGTPAMMRLDPSDAENVDVIHTDAKPFIPFLGFGMLSPVGTVDFYMNGGSVQPGCFTMDAPNITSLRDLLNYPCEVVSKWVSCSHGRSYEYFIASLNQNNCSFCGRKMSETETFLKTSTLGRLKLADPIVKELSSCSKDTCSVLGLETFTLPSRGSFAVTTDDDPPYCEVTAEENRKLRAILNLDVFDHITSGLNYIGKKLRLI